MAQKLLIINCSPANRDTLDAYLRGGESLEVHYASDSEAALALSPDVIIVDAESNPLRGFEMCRRLRQMPISMAAPTLLLTGRSSPEEQAQALDLGVSDYLSHPLDSVQLRARLNIALRTKAMLDLLANSAMIDGLTGLWNRPYFEERMDAETSLSRRSLQPLSCILIDIDHLNDLNEAHGCPLGDDVLRATGRILVEAGRKEDVIARFAGEEFAILAPQTAAVGAAELAERVRAAVNALTWTGRGKTIRTTCSIGVADLLHSPRAPKLLARAELALAQAKQWGCNRVVVADPVMPSDPVKREVA